MKKALIGYLVTFQYRKGNPSTNQATDQAQQVVCINLIKFLFILQDIYNIL